MTATLRVSLESAGTHQFDMPELRRCGTVDLVAQLLRNAGFSDTRPKWVVRVDNKVTSTGHTQPISIIGKKPHCISIKIKPGDNNTCHRCSLLIPEGSPKGFATTLEQRLKAAENQTCVDWKPQRAKKQEEEPVTIAAALEQEITEVVSQEEPVTVVGNNGIDFLRDSLDIVDRATEQAEQELPIPTATRFSAKKFLRDPANVRRILFEIHQLQFGSYQNRDQYMDVLRKKLGWEDFTRYQTGSVMGNLHKEDYIPAHLQGATITKYELQEKGLSLIKDMIEAAKPLPPAPKVNPTNVIRSLGKVGDWFHKASNRLYEIEEEKKLLSDRLIELAHEEARICAVIDNPKVQGILSELVNAQLNVQEASGN